MVVWIILKIVFTCHVYQRCILLVVILLSYAYDYYERGGHKSPLHITILSQSQAYTLDMNWYHLYCCDLFLYEMLMHMNRVNYTLLLFVSCFVISTMAKF
jgi:hypothetical protein